MSAEARPLPARGALPLLLVLLLGGSGPTGMLAQNQNAGPQATPRTLRVMSYNIKHGQTNASCAQPPRIPGEDPAPDCNLDLQASIDVMRANAADIVAVQEVDRFWARSAYVDEPAAIAAGLGMEHRCYAANLDHAPDTHSSVPHQYGTVIVSRFPILDCSNTLLPRTGSNEQRGLTRAMINVRGVPLQLYNTHLHTTAADRLLQTAVIGEVVDAAPAGSRVLMGDFNAGPTAAEMAPIFARFVDAWSAGSPVPANPSGNTSPARLAGSPTSRIDYVLVSSQVKVTSSFVPIDAATRLAADHYPVVADIALPGSEAGIGDAAASVVPHRAGRRACLRRSHASWVLPILRQPSPPRDAAGCMAARAMSPAEIRQVSPGSEVAQSGRGTAMDNDDIQKKQTPDTTEYSATKAPENKEHVESSSPTGDHRLLPGGAHGARVPIGMSELDHAQVPSGASDLDLIHFGEEPASGLSDEE